VLGHLGQWNHITELIGTRQLAAAYRARIGVGEGDHAVLDLLVGKALPNLLHHPLGEGHGLFQALDRPTPRVRGGAFDARAGSPGGLDHALGLAQTGAHLCGGLLGEALHRALCLPSPTAQRAPQGTQALAHRTAAIAHLLAHGRDQLAHLAGGSGQELDPVGAQPGVSGKADVGFGYRGVGA
jgi:hypothetical protein